MTAWCDEQRLAQVLRALVDNAVKFSPPGSTVRIGVQAEEKWATVVVSDDGPGIPAAELPHVFERFHRGSEERATTTGAGLGLSIARELTEMMGGTIRAEAGRGPRRQLLRAPAAAAPQAPGGGPRRAEAQSGTRPPRSRRSPARTSGLLNLAAARHVTERARRRS